MNQWLLRGMDSWGTWQVHGYTAACKMDNQQGTLPSVMWQPGWELGVGFVGEWIHVYVWPSPLAVHLKLSQHC